MFVIVREDRQYVARKGSDHAYTRKLARAHVYSSAREAALDLCVDNETIVPIEELLAVA